MTNDADAILDDLLARWHAWQQGTHVGRGHADRALVCGDNYRPSRQYDDENGKLDDDLDARRSRAVDHAASKLTDPYRAAIYCNARNLATGRTVWHSPRLPTDPAARDRVLFCARVQMVKLLVSAGVM